MTGDGLEALHPLEAELIEAGALHDRAAERMLRAGLEGIDNAEDAGDQKQDQRQQDHGIGGGRGILQQ